MKRYMLFTATLAFACFSQIIFAAPKPIKPVDSEGKPLNFDFEDGTLKDWDPVGSAFEKQPVKGDTVHSRRQDMKSQHHGNYWIGTYEGDGDQPLGTMTSVPFKATHPFASFLIGGGSHEETRVELLTASDQKVFFKTSAFDSENMRPVVVDLNKVQGKNILIRLVDEHRGGWGHINFDDFVFYDQSPNFPNDFEVFNDELAAELKATTDWSALVPTGAILDHQEKLGGAKCYFLVHPLGAEKPTADGLGRFCRFKGGGSIYWTIDYGAWSIHGRIRDKWWALDAEAGILGYPVTDETAASDGVGRFNHFKNPRLDDQEGSIYYTPSIGAWEVHGPIREKWMSLGAERSSLGYPISDQFALDDGTGRVRNKFQHGTITLDPKTVVVTTP